jgi:ParB family transcriptional regulator, chromosome partitioning protein
MSAKPTSPRLGRGLAALLGDMPANGTAAGSVTDTRQVAIDLLDPNPFQPRTEFDEESLKDLTDSIRTSGILQPILVRPHPEVAGRFQIIAGERRWRAAGLAEMHDIPVICRELNDVESAAAALVENLQRENLNPIDEAEGYQRLVKDFGLTQEALGTAVSKSRAHVGNIMRLLTLPESVRTEVRKGLLSQGHARAILTVPDPAKAAAEVLKKGLSVRQTEKLAARLQSPPQAANEESAAAEPGPDVAQAEKDLASRLGYKVKISATQRGDGSLTIWFNDLFQLDDLVARLTAPQGETTSES